MRPVGSIVLASGAMGSARASTVGSSVAGWASRRRSGGAAAPRASGETLDREGAEDDRAGGRATRKPTSTAGGVRGQRPAAAKREPPASSRREVGVRSAARSAPAEREGQDEDELAALRRRKFGPVRAGTGADQRWRRCCPPRWRDDGEDPRRRSLASSAGLVDSTLLEPVRAARGGLVELRQERRKAPPEQNEGTRA